MLLCFRWLGGEVPGLGLIRGDCRTGLWGTAGGGLRRGLCGDEGPGEGATLSVVMYLFMWHD